MRKREMKVGMKVSDSEFKKWGTGTIIEVEGRVFVQFKNKCEASYRSC